MQVNALAGSQSSSLTSSPIQISSDDFMTLLIAQLQNQDPLSPMESQEFIAQLAQLETVSKLGDISDYMKLSGDFSSPLSTLGHTVHWRDSSGQPYQGTVTAIVKDSAGYYRLVVNDQQLQLGQIERIE